MERKYYYARTVGAPESILQMITTTVVDAQLASQIPLVKLERQAKGQFYVFLGVDSDESAGIPGDWARPCRVGAYGLKKISIASGRNKTYGAESRLRDSRVQRLAIPAKGI